MTDKSYVPPIGRVLTPYLCCRDAAKAIEWYGEVFGAKLVWDPFVGADGRTDDLLVTRRTLRVAFAL
jgi:PhnB protein